MKRTSWNKGKKLSQSHVEALKVAASKRIIKDYKGKVKKVCEECLCEFNVFLYLKEKARFCSARCRVKNVSNSMKGEKHFAWKGGYENHLWHNRQRRIKKIGNGGFHDLSEWENLKAQYNWTCPCCSKQEPEIKLSEDHIIPVSKGGSDNIENIQPLCRLCNSRKHNKIIKYIV